MTTHEALRALELRSMPQTADQIGQAFARKAQGIQALLQFPLGNKARSPLLDELVTLQDAHNVLMQMVSQRPPLVKNAAPAPNGVGPGIMTWARTALDSLRLLNEKIRHTAERVYEIGSFCEEPAQFAVHFAVDHHPTCTPCVGRGIAGGADRRHRRLVGGNHDAAHHGDANEDIRCRPSRQGNRTRLSGYIRTRTAGRNRTRDEPSVFNTFHSIHGPANSGPGSVPHLSTIDRIRRKFAIGRSTEPRRVYAGTGISRSDLGEHRGRPPFDDRVYPLGRALPIGTQF